MRPFLTLILVAGLLAEVFSEGEWCGKNDTFKHPAEGTCMGYWDCDHGNITYKRCSYLYSFDSASLECVWNPTGYSDVPCSADSGPKGDDKWCSVGKRYKAPVNGLCDSYYDCQSGLLEVKTCTWPTSFNSRERVCRVNVWPYEFSCNPDPSDSHAVKPQCSGGQSFNTVYSEDCSKFYSCDDGKLSIKRCGFMQKFDPTTLECRYDYPWNKVDCAAPPAVPTNKPPTSKTVKTPAPTPSPTTPATPAPTPSPTTPATPAPTPSTTPSPSEKLVCLKGNYYTVPHPDDCQKYLVCSNGTVSVQECSMWQYFNPLTHECQTSFFSSVNCSAKTDKPFCTTGYNYRKSYPGDSKKYYQCSDATLNVESCGFMQSYDDSKQDCHYSIFGLNLKLAPNHGFKCAKDEYYNSTYPGDCHQYYSCRNGTLNTLECPYAQKYDPKYGKCIWMTNCDLLICNAKGPLCYKGFDYVTSVPDHCDKYSECKNGSWSLKTCSWFHKFDPTTLECKLNLFNSVNCKAKTKCSQKSLLGVTVSNAQVKKSFKSQGGATHLITMSEDLGVPKCWDGEKFKTSDPKDCSSYYDCDNGKLEVKQCSYMEKFDPKILDCRFDSPWNPVDCSSLPGQPACATGQTFDSVYPEHCDRYYYCNNGSLSVETCHFWQKFDPATLDCRMSIPWIYSVNCSAKPGSASRSNVKPSSSNTNAAVRPKLQIPNCKEGRTFKTVNPKDCSSYYNCNNGKMEVKQCSYFDKFDPSTLDCRFDSSWNPVNCNNLPGQPSCNKGHDFKSVLPEHCNRYYNCNNGSLHVETCHFWQKFDPATLECRMSIPWIYSVNCSAKPGSEIERAKPTTQSKANEAVTTPTPPKGPPCSVGQIFKSVYADDCKKYFDCSNETETVESCFWLRKFNPAKLECNWDMPFFRVNCSAIPGSELPKPIVYPDNVKSKCQKGMSFNAVDKKDCKSYYECSNGSLSYETCGWLRKFNPATLKCSFDLPLSRVNCTSMPGEPRCPSNGTIRKAYPGDCGKYYECKNGTLSVQHCNFLQKFDHKKLSCAYEWPTSPVDCGTDAS